MRHAQAQTLQIEITFKVGAIALRIQDDGSGFDLQSAHDRGGFGLLGMQQRCDRLGGQFTLRSQPGQGTCILVQIPQGTVKFHITNILQKLGVSDRTQAVVTAFQSGIANL